MVRVRVSTLWFHPLAPPPGRPHVVSGAARSPSMSTAPTTAVDQQTLDPLAVQPQVGGSPVWPSHQQPRWSPLEPQYPTTSSTPSTLPTPTNAVPPVVSSMGAYLKLHTSRNIYKGLRDSGLLGRTPIVSDSWGARARGVRGAWDGWCTLQSRDGNNALERAVSAKGRAPHQILHNPHKFGNQCARSARSPPFYRQALETSVYC